jgi:acetylornithine/N-succinyldiaminopimelate aminotransferase
VSESGALAVIGTASEFETHARRVLLANYRPSLVLVEGRGCEVRDADGRWYLDLSAGVAVTSVGHAHPHLAKAIAEQASRLMHVSNVFYNDRAIQLAGQLAARTGFARTFFCNSGTEANEALLKLARRYHFERGATERVEILSTTGSFHGRTMGALSLSGQAKYHEGMGPLLGGIRHVPFDDLDAVRAVIGPRTAAVIVEPIQAEGGIVVPGRAYLRGLRELCNEHGALLFFDEVQTGFGRTGTFLAAEQWGVVPDACSLAKGIAGGFPMGAMLVQEPLASGLPPGSHASTFGGNPLACAASLAVLEIFEKEQVLGNVRTRSAELLLRAHAMAAAHPCVDEARGMGLLVGLALASTVDPAAVLAELRGAGVLATLCGGRVLRLTPALNISAEQLARGLDAVERVLTQADRPLLVREG